MSWPPLNCILDRNEYYAVGFSSYRAWSWLRLPVRTRTSPTYRSLAVWYQVVATYDGVTRRHYVNASPDGSWTENAPLELYNSMRIVIGANANDTDTSFASPSGFVMCYIPIVRIYSRALSAEEVSQNYVNSLSPVRNGLVLWLQAHPDNVKDVDGDGVLEWVDLSGYGNHGKIYGATLVEVVKSPARVLSPARVVPTV